MLGVLGGRRIVGWRNRQAVAELWEALEGLNLRLSRREGKAGAEAKKLRGEVPDQALFGAWLQRMRGQARTSVQVVPDEATGVKIAQAHFARDVKKKKEETLPDEQDVG